MSEPLLEVGLRLVTEDSPGFIDAAEEPVLLVPDPPLPEYYSSGVLGDLVDPLGQVQYLDLAARAQVECFADSLFIVGHPDEAVHDVANVGEVPGLVTGARDGQRLLVDGPVHEVGNDVPVPALIKSLKEEEWSVKEKAAEALGNIGPDAKASSPALKEAMNEAFEANEYKPTWKPRELLFPLAKALGKIAPDMETILLLLSRRFVESDRWDEKEAILTSLGEFGQEVMKPEVVEIVDIYTGITDFIDDQYHHMEDELVGYYRIPEEVIEALKKVGYHNTRIGT